MFAQLLFCLYFYHIPLYLQSQIFALHGFDLYRSTLAAISALSTGGSSRSMNPVLDRLRLGHQFVTDTPVPVLDPDADARRPDVSVSMPESPAGLRPRCPPRSLCSRQTAELTGLFRFSIPSGAYSILWLFGLLALVVLIHRRARRMLLPFFVIYYYIAHASYLSLATEACA